MKKHIILCTLILALGIAAASVQAAGILTPLGSTHQPIQIRDHAVNVVINNGFAMTEVRQTFYNPNPENLEAMYSFPLPKSASLSEVTIYVGEREIHGEVLEKQKARQIYEDEKSRGNESGLAEKTDDTFKKIYRGEQLVFFGKYQNGGDARVTLKANLTGEDKTYTCDFRFPDLDTANPELERLWALAAIEKIEARERIGAMPPSESENAIRDIGLGYQIVTDYTSMVVLSGSAYADRGIERRNQARIAREQQARAVRSQQPATNYRVDEQKPAFKFKAPSLGGGGGAIDPMTGGLAAFFAAIAAAKLIIRRKRQF